MSLIYTQSDNPRELVEPVIKWLGLGRRVVMTTLVNIEGNAPYPVGSQMAVNDRGDYLGQITGGCAETAIADQALMVMSNGESKTLRYGLDSPFFDIQLPCGSGIDVFFDCEITLESMSAIADQLSAREVYRQTLDTALGAFERTYLPSTRLMLFGQGPILVMLAELAIKSGFDVACIAQNEHTLAILENAGLDGMPLHQAQNRFAAELDKFGAMVSLFHDHDIETALLAGALNTDAFYIGALGSKRTHLARLEALRSCGVDESSFGRIYGPVGKNIGANTPAQIAVSILAEVIESLNAK